MKRYTIWMVKPWCGDRSDCIAEYYNWGHVVAALRGLRRRAWLAGSEMQYKVQREF